MKIETTAVLFLAAGSVFGQTPQTAGLAYQQAGAIGVFSTAGAPAVQATFELPAGVTTGFANPSAMTGSPFSATRESRSLQVLGDGTRIDHTESSRFYRDSQGRTRTESGPAGAATVMIQDSVGGITLILNPSAKTAQKITAMKFPAPAVPALPAGAGVMEAGSTKSGPRFVELHSATNAMGPGTMTAAIGAGSITAVRGAMIAATPALALNTDGTPPQVADLGTQNVNGVLAEGKRTTLVIPSGQIGNDRPINVVGETWYSAELQMIVKSLNSDPRFGDTTFEMINISRAEPDPALFQVPADYSVSSPKMDMMFRTTQPRE